MWDGNWKRSWRRYVLYISYEPLSYALAPDENSYRHTPLFVLWDWIVCTACVHTAVCCMLSIGIKRERRTEVTDFCDGHICLACVWPWSPVCRSTCMSQQCSRSESSCTDWPEPLVRHTHRCLEEINTSAQEIKHRIKTKLLLASAKSSIFFLIFFFYYKPIQRVREWSSLKPVLHSHMVPR